MSEAKQINTTCRFHWRRLIVRTIIAVWLGWWTHKARQQREAVEALEKADALVTHDYNLPWTGEMRNRPLWPQWLLDEVGINYFADVKMITLSYTKVTDTDLEHLRSLVDLQTLNLHHTKVTDAGLKHLQGLTALQLLALNNTNVTDAGLKDLQNLTALQFLWLDNTQVTDAGLEHIKNLSGMKWVDLTNTKVTDAGVARLQKVLPNCTIHH